MPFIEEVLDSANIKGSFFVTGRFLEDKKAEKIVKRMIENGHYFGPHSDQHLLYSPWENRDSLLVTKSMFVQDLEANTQRLADLGMKDISMFIPPYEWYNAKIVQWSKELGLDVYNFTPGIRTAADYTYPEMGARYMSSDKIIEQLLQYEEDKTLNGAIILIHIGTDPRRRDKFYKRLAYIINELQAKNYKFATLIKN